MNRTILIGYDSELKTTFALFLEGIKPIAVKVASYTTTSEIEEWVLRANLPASVTKHPATKEKE